MQRYGTIMALAAIGLTFILPGCRSADIPAIESARREFGDTVRLGTAYDIPGRSAGSKKIFETAIAVDAESELAQSMKHSLAFVNERMIAKKPEEEN